MAAPRKPQDHKDSKVAVHAAAQESVDNVAGIEFLTPITEVTAVQQARLMGRVTKSGLIPDDVDLEEIQNNPNSAVSVSSVDIEKLGDLIEYVQENFVVDADGFDRFQRGPGAFNRCAELIVEYVGALGKDEA